MISWKHSLKRLNEEYEIAKKKRQALDNLLSTNRISPSTHETFNKEIDETIVDIEKQQKALLEKIGAKAKELEEQIKTLEMFLANFEIQHVTGEVTEEVYQREINLLSAGLDTARQELGNVVEALNQLSGNVNAPTAEVSVQPVEPQPTENVEVSQSEVKVQEEPAVTIEEKASESSAESIEVVEAIKTDSFQAQQDTPQDAAQNKEEPQQAEANVEGEEKQEA